MQNYLVNNWFGILSRPKEDGIPKGYASNMLNWIVLRDRIELRRGSEILGAEISGGGKVTGLKVGKKINGEELLVRTRARKVEYYDLLNETWVETLSKTDEINIIAEDADGLDTSIQEYQSMAGSFLYISGPKTRTLKLPIATPSVALEVDDDVYRGYTRILNGVTFLWNREGSDGGKDSTGLYRSVVDRDELSDYEVVTDEVVGTGDGATKTFTGFFSGLSEYYTAHYAVFTDGVEIFQDDRNGLLVGNQGGIGTINYASGEFTIEFHTAPLAQEVITPSINYVENNTVVVGGKTLTFKNTPAGESEIKVGATIALSLDAIVACVNDSENLASAGPGEVGTLYCEPNVATRAVFDNLLATDNTTNATFDHQILVTYYKEKSDALGIFDFGKSTPRIAGDGFVLREDSGGGAIKNVAVLDGVEYPFHEKNVWKVTIADSDETASNIIYRNNAGIQNWRSMVETDEGIYYIDSSKKEDPYIRVMKPGYNNPNILPKSISDNIDLSGYDFSEGGIGKWGPYIVVWGKVKEATVNNRTFLFHTIDRTWTVLDYRLNCLDSYNGVLVGGDSGSNNVLNLFNGITDDETEITNFYETGDDDLGKKGSQLGLERFHQFIISGLIQRDQSFDIYFSYDNGKYVKIGTINGNASYVDIGTKVSVGNYTLGSEVISGGEILASPYKSVIKVHTPRFEDLKIKFVAQKIGYISIHDYEIKDRREKGNRIKVKYDN